MTPSSEFDNAYAWLHLLRAGLPSARLRGAIERSESAARLLDGTAASRRSAGLEPGDETTLSAVDPQQIASDLAWIEQPDHHLIGWDSVDYPALLRRVGSPPPALLVAGDPTLLWSPQIAVIGSRNPTEGGRRNAADFARALSRDGWLVSSGLADGIDASAHRAALDAGAATLAVIGTGPDIVYPAINRQLAERIVAQGAMVSEFLPGTEARREHFPRRNRILAGLCLGTLVVEAASRSGALITARLAGEIGREVFAIPGSIHNPMARGCHQLIRQGAGLVETVAEIVEALAPVAAELAEALRHRLQPTHSAPVTLTETSSRADTNDDADQAQLLRALGHDPVDIDTLAQRTGLTVNALSSMLLIMELDGRVAARNGRYQRLPD